MHQTRAGRRTAALLVGMVALATLAATAGHGRPVLGWGDQGDGTYRNPILKADYSDPDAIAVGSDFYLVASDFHFVGMQVLRSRDLVNWRIVGQVFDRLGMNARYDEMQGYAQGTWAPALRYHNGEFFVYVCTPHDGLFMWHARSPAGPWSDTVTVKAVDGWEDPCPFWDEDGQAYLVHSRVGAGPLILHKMSADGTRLLDDGVEIYRGNVAEGPKLFKRGATYFISLPEGGVGGGGQTVLRAANIYGPYERKEVLPAGSPHQGGWVDLPNGETWFIGFKSTGRLGRVCHLIPVRWGEDGWPVFGENGKTVERWKKPNVGRTHPIERPETSDTFDAATLAPQWQWNHNPVPSAWSLGERRGWLRLKALPADTLAGARNTLTQKLWDDAGVVDAELDVSAMRDGQRAGLTFLSGAQFDWIGVVQEGSTRRIQWEGGTGPVLDRPRLRLRLTYQGDTGRFAYSLDGRHFTDAGIACTLKFGKWKGARFGIFCYGANGGALDVNEVRYRYGETPAAISESPQ